MKKINADFVDKIEIVGMRFLFVKCCIIMRFRFYGKDFIHFLKIY